MLTISNLKLNAGIAQNISDNYTINKPSGLVTIRAGDDRCWVTNSLVKENSFAFANLLTVDQSAKSARVTECADGSFVIRLDNYADADCQVCFLIVTPVE